MEAGGKETGDLLQDVFEACFYAEGYRPGEAELRRLLAEAPVRLVIDDLAAAAVDRVLDAVPRGGVVFSGASRADHGDVQVLDLGGLGRDPAIALLAAVLGGELGERSRAEAVWNATGGEPLGLLRAAAGAIGGELPPPGRVADLVPTLIATLDEAALRVLALLGLPGCGAVRPSLLDDLVPMGGAAAERLARMGLAVETVDGHRIAAGPVTAPNPAAAEIRATARVLRAWALAPDRTPEEIAAHADLLAAVTAAASRTGDAESGGLLARAASPGAATSLRLGAWGRILEQGKAAAERAGDRRTLAYLLHEDGVRLLLAGRRAASASALAAAAVLWRELGDPAGAVRTEEAREVLRHGASVADLQPVGRPEPVPEPRAERSAPEPHTPAHAAPRSGGGSRAKHAVPSTGRGFRFVVGGGLALAAVAGGYAAVAVAASDTVAVKLAVRTAVLSAELPGDATCDAAAGGTDCTSVIRAEKGEPRLVVVRPALPSGVVDLRYWGCDEGPESRTCTVTAEAERTVCATTVSPRDADARAECAALTEEAATGRPASGVVSLAAPTQWKVSVEGAPVACAHGTDEIGSAFDPITGKRRCGEFRLTVGRRVTLTAVIGGQVPAKGRFVDPATVDRTPVWYGCDEGPEAAACTLTMTRDLIETAREGGPAAVACVATRSAFDFGARTICADLTGAPHPAE
ncbi:hypothetical protein LO762_12600 [Actinocorallia sp. API 0066]|uniref:hypothetical protein n=1 Tax=Actinocorallia sp. API 0066 TaxID=2896846 RepID=UPI001E41EC04|nr:hypothetical protein [Actinocorallia sp. API 0066]MCD0450026.1 hypothetical protein [Actinocorallia sp. API 0066]